MNGLTTARRLCAPLLAMMMVFGLLGSTSAQDKKEGNILLGHYASMTGSEATFGTSTDNAAKLAIDEINAAGGVLGRKVEMKTYDTQSKTQEAGNAVTRLVTQDKVVAVIGEVASSRSLAGAPICQQYGVPMVSPASTNPRVTTVGDKIFRVCFIDPFQGFVAAKFIHDNLKLSDVAILYDSTQAYSTGLQENFKEAFVEMGGKIVSEQAYSGGDSDFSAQLNTIRDAKPQAIYIPGYYTEAATIAVQARKIGLNVPLLGGDGWDSAKLAEIGGKAIEGCYYTNHYAADDPRPEVQSFIASYKKLHGETPDALAALGYDAAKIVCDAITRAGTTESGALTKALAATKDYQGVTGKITIDEERNASKTAVVVQMKDGKPVFAASIDP